jgi:thiamine-monophosphate kinase
LRIARCAGNTMSNLTPLAHGAEFDKIRAIWRALGDRGVGGGDDCAIVQLGSETVALSTDMMVEGVHFREGWLQPWELGWRVGAAALSDLAAVAAEPRGVLVSLAVSPGWPDAFVAELVGGVGEVAASVGALVWGGDVVRGDRLAVDVVVVGTVSHPVLRSSARPGEELWVTGRLGGPLEAVRAWEARGEPERTVRQRFAHPEPRVAEAVWLKSRGARAAIDLSDGLAQDAAQLAAASRVRLVIDVESVPRHPAVDDCETALASGEEFELLVTLPGDSEPDLARRFGAEHSLDLTRIGVVAVGEGLVLERGGEQVAPPAGFSHF